MFKTIYLVGLVALLTACSNGQTNSTTAQTNNPNLSVTEFAAKIKATPNASIIDVRTPQEYSEGHLENAVNYNWNSNQFSTQVADLDKTKPVFVYCLSGGRSASAANKLRSLGFTEVYEMNGGIMKWNAANLPLTIETKTDSKPQTKGMSLNQFQELVKSDKIVLVDFYADWCAPCKKMEPYLTEISKDMAETVVLVRINADENKELCAELKIDAIPVLQVYKNQQISWNSVGFVEKAEVVKQLM